MPGQSKLLPLNATSPRPRFSLVSSLYFFFLLIWNLITPIMWQRKNKLTSKVSDPGHPPVTRTWESDSSLKRPLKIQGSTLDRLRSSSTGIGLYLFRMAMRSSLPILMERSGTSSEDLSVSQMNLGLSGLSFTSDAASKNWIDHNGTTWFSCLHFSISQIYKRNKMFA